MNNIAKLTAKQKQFCEEYLIDLNGTRAYKAVYHSCKKDETASVNSSRMLRNAKVQEYIAERQQALQQRTEITQDMVLKELASIGFADIIDYAEVAEKTYTDFTGREKSYTDVDIKLTAGIDATKRRAISSIKQGKNGIEIKLNDKIKALELIGKHIGMFNDKEDDTKQLDKLDTVLDKIEGKI